MTEHPNASATVTAFIRAIEAKDLDTACDLVAPDCEYDNVPIGKVYGPEGIRSVLEGFIGGFDQVEWVVHHQLSAAANDHAGLVMNERTDRFGSGDRWLELPVAGLFEVRDGRIVLWRDYFDRDTLMRQWVPEG